MKRSKIRFYANYTWSTLWWVTLLSVFAYVFLEWLFIITKPSVLSMLSFGEKFRVFLFTFSLAALMSYLFTKGTQGVFAVIRHKTLKYLGLFLPTFTLSTLCLLLFDNFTYTLLGGGIATSSGLFTALYLLLYVDLLALVFLKLNQKLPSFEQFTALHRTKWAEPLSVLGLAILLLLTYQPPKVIQRPSINATNLAQPLPHILLITADGLNAEHMSVYGYERDTTPNLRELAEVSLVGENHFSNASITMGGIISIFTGKYPTSTRVIFPPNMLRGENAYEHLPYILKSIGYDNYQFSFLYYADSVQANLLSGFDIVNWGKPQEDPVFLFLKRVVGEDISLFIHEIIKRATDRLRHIFFIKPMLNFRTITPTRNNDLSASLDRIKLDSVVNIITTSSKPVFIHLHWMETHPTGENTFTPSTQKFSAGKDINNSQPKDLDFYDDAILGFDNAVGEILDALNNNDLMDNTILVITSDHGLWFTSLSRLPLLIHFPYNQYSGRIKANTQSIDIAPTLLEYLNIPIPTWMEGKPLLHCLNQKRLIFSAEKTEAVFTAFGVFVVKDSPPFYSIGSVVLISCDTWYRLRLNERVWESGKVSGSTNTCTPIDEGQAFDAIIQHLRERGFDTSSVEDFSQIQRAAP